MKKLLFLSTLAATIILTGCVKKAPVAYAYTADIAVCATLDDGTKQTFPSMQELERYSGATYLHDGPCYE